MLTYNRVVEQNGCIEHAYPIASNTSISCGDKHVDFISDVGSVRLLMHPGKRHSLVFVLTNKIELEVSFAYAGDLKHALRWLAGQELLPVVPLQKD